ncbi:MAG: class I SAM-dependent methyltransferase [Thermodesulfobacteriota bacterium]
MGKSLKGFYEDYWQRRKDLGKIYTEKDGYIPERLKVVTSMISGQGRRINVLDVGCGEGTLGILLRKKLSDIDIVGCDIAENSVELARPFYDKVFQADIDEDDLKGKAGGARFDYIVCVEVIEHILYPEKLLNRCKELLAEGGYIIVSFPNIAWWRYRLKLLRGHFPEESRLYHHAEHLHDFTMHTFTKLLNDTGLEPVEIGGEFVPPVFMRCLGPGRLVEKLMKKYPNLFGYQVVIKTRAA